MEIKYELQRVCQPHGVSLPPADGGYIRQRKIAAEFVAGGALGGIFGMKAAVRLSAKKRVLNYVFAGVVFSAAAYMLVRTGFHLFPI